MHGGVTAHLSLLSVAPTQQAGWWLAGYCCRPRRKGFWRHALLVLRTMTSSGRAPETLLRSPVAGPCGAWPLAPCRSPL
jgi:hypothetical protein